jgi:hypothetical protein
VDEPRDERLAENEALFREMNERMAAWQERRDAPLEKHMFFCECASRVCHERVHMTIPEYVAVRESPVRFAVLPEHVFPGLERVVEEREGYVIVEKHERFRHVVEQADERWAASPDGGPRRANG